MVDFATLCAALAMKGIEYDYVPVHLVKDGGEQVIKENWHFWFLYLVFLQADVFVFSVEHLGQFSCGMQDARE